MVLSGQAIGETPHEVKDIQSDCEGPWTKPSENWAHPYNKQHAINTSNSDCFQSTHYQFHKYTAKTIHQTTNS